MKNLAASVFNNDIIVLDLNDDEYYITESTEDTQLIDENILFQTLEAFEEYNLIFSNLKNTFKNSFNSYLEERWTPQLTEFSPQGNIIYLFRLIKSSLKLKHISKKLTKNGWFFILNNIPPVINKKLDSEHKALAINICLWLIEKTFYLNPNKTDCITTSVTLQHLLAQEGIHSVIVLGVRTRPFFAHAWLEVDGKIINDKDNLRDFLSVILEVKS
ncbi:lasso peptide biosynthesis B2 protein [Salmonella enterica]|nr:lasso peptide biosynthesis B2 protein [Salmonella enterica]